VSARDYDCFVNREIPHDWRRIPFWHPNRWADGWGWRCGKCGVVRDEDWTPGKARLWLAGIIVWWALALWGALDLMMRIVHAL
jgi:hypothetical protein